MENNESSLTKSISSELENLLAQLGEDIKKRNSIKKYLSQVRNAFQQPNAEILNKLLLKKTKEQLLIYYPFAQETFEKLSIDVKRTSGKTFNALLGCIKSHCESNQIPLQGRAPKFFIDHLVEVEMNEKKQTAKIGTIFFKTLNWEKIKVGIDKERNRVWDREFDPTNFRDKLLSIRLEILKVKPNPVGWVRLEDVYQILKKQIQERNPDWKKGGRLVAYYKDEFSADLSKLWGAQAEHKTDFPHIELSGIRDPRLSFLVVLPNNQIGSYGHMRPRKES